MGLPVVIMPPRLANNDMFEVRACRPAANPDASIFAVSFARTMADVPSAEREARAMLAAYEAKLEDVAAVALAGDGDWVDTPIGRVMIDDSAGTFWIHAASPGGDTAYALSATTEREDVPALISSAMQDAKHAWDSGDRWTGALHVHRADRRRETKAGGG